MSLDPYEIEALAERVTIRNTEYRADATISPKEECARLACRATRHSMQTSLWNLVFKRHGSDQQPLSRGDMRGTAQMSQEPMMGLLYDKLDVSTEDMENVDLYMQSLGVPARRDVGDPVVQMGEQKFYEAKCHLCHVTTLHTRPGGSTLLNRRRLPRLGSQTIHPYSDFLLHDMGTEIMGVGLNDNYVSGLAMGNEWRTTPLWGIGLQEKVNGHTYFLHDGAP